MLKASVCVLPVLELGQYPCHPLVGDMPDGLKRPG